MRYQSWGNFNGLLVLSVFLLTALQGYCGCGGPEVGLVYNDEPCHFIVTSIDGSYESEICMCTSSYPAASCTNALPAYPKYSGHFTIPSTSLCSRMQIASIECTTTGIATGAFKDCTGLLSVVIPSSVTYINDNAFSGCTYLNDVRVGSGIVKIGTGVFKGCYNLQTIQFEGNVPSGLSASLFSDCINLSVIYVPCGKLSLFQKALSGLDVPIEEHSSFSYSITSSNTSQGTVSVIENECYEIVATATPKAGWKFRNWSDGNRDNPRAIVLNQDVTLIAYFVTDKTPTKGVVEVDFTQEATQISDWTIGSDAQLNETATSITTGKYVYDYIGASSDDYSTMAYMNAHPNILFQYKASYVREKAFAIYPGQYFYVSSSNWLIVLKEMLPSAKIRLTMAARDNKGASVEASGGFPKNATLLSTDLTLPGKGSTGGDENGFVWKTIEYKALGGDVQIKGPSAGFVIKRIEYETQDAILYTITYKANIAEAGYVEGSTSAHYNETITPKAIPYAGYHFSHWHTGDANNPRYFKIQSDTTITAYFEHDDVTVTYVGADGVVLGSETIPYGSNATAAGIKTDQFGYTFTGWDHNLTNITENTTIHAVYTRTSINGLYYLFDMNSHTATLDYEGNAYASMNEVAIPSSFIYNDIHWTVTAIGDFAFANCTQVASVAIPNTVKTIGDYAFANINSRKFNSIVFPHSVQSIGKNVCANDIYLENIEFGDNMEFIGDSAFLNCSRVMTMTCWSEYTPNVGVNALSSIKSSAELYVRNSCLRKYEMDDNWNRFILKEIGATETTEQVTDVSVVPEDNTALFTWPTNTNASTYTLAITKDGELFCTLIFNANGQLAGIAFAPGRNGGQRTPSATLVNGGMQFTVTGLDIATVYNFALTTKDASARVLAEYNGRFGTTGAFEAVENIHIEGEQPAKVLHDGQIYILRGKKIYTVTGQIVR